jgi:hypothetical protein
MDRLLLFFLIYSLFAYTLGIICSRKNFFSIDFLKRNWPDLIYFLFIALICIWIVQIFWQENPQNTVQILIFSITAAALIYQGFASKIFRSYLDRPIVKMLFDETKSEYFHRTLMRIYTEILHSSGNSVIPMIDFVPAYYSRFKVLNEGNTTLENTEVIVEGVEPLKTTKLLRPFMPLNLHWAFAEDKERRKINIPPNNAYRIIDFFELMKPQSVNAYASKLVPGNVDFDRYKALVTGFRICSVPPNTLSDIYEKGSYIFTVGIYSNNSKPQYKKVFVEYDGLWDDDPNIMRENHLKVKLLG